MTEETVDLTARFRERLKAGEHVYGAFIGSNAPAAVNAFARTGWDFVILEGQHSALGTADLMGLLDPLQYSRFPALVRVGGHDQYQISKMLDGGAAGVIVPMVETAEQARHVVGGARFRPNGERSFGPIRGDLIGMGPKELEDRALVFVMVETQLGLDNVEEIAATPGVDGIFAGMADMAISQGRDPLAAYTSDIMQPEFERLKEVCDRHGVILGAPAFDEHNAVRWRDNGCQLVSVSYEVALLGNAARSAIETLRPGSSGKRDASSPYG